MNSNNKEFTSKKFATSKKIIWLITSVLLILNIKNIQSNEISSSTRHHQIEISGFAFTPKDIKVNIGDTISWINKDIVPHNIVDITQKKLLSADLSNGERHTFIVTDTMLYKCGLHPSMKGKLSLFDSP